MNVVFQSCSFRVKVSDECAPGGSFWMVKAIFEQVRKFE